MLEAERASLALRVGERTAELSAANAELARTARLKDEFLANMSHELRTPLNAILGMSQVLRNEVYGSLNGDQLDALEHIEEGGSHLLDLINDILDLSKIEAGKLELNIGPALVNVVCQASLLFIKQEAQKKRIKVISEGDDSVDTIQADQRRLKQILVNLLSNAVKFTPDGGRVGLKVKYDQAQEVVHFTVWDTGIGISEEDMKHLFDPFVQIDSKLSRQHEGTGLGLSLVARLAELHGGGLFVESKEGQGSRFTVSLPWSMTDSSAQIVNDDPPSVEHESVSPATNGQQSAHILFAEDNEVNIITVRDFLQAKGYRVTVARNGVEALERAKEERPNMILMDIQMPEMDGLEATRHLRTDDKLNTVPVVALTALAMPGDRERCLAAGANEYLSKPVNLKRLVEVIEIQLQQVDDRNQAAELISPSK
jgi:CheY-like chemotaxis protein/nitrogen-specific signal transduction histidine kinase